MQGKLTILFVSISKINSVTMAISISDSWLERILGVDFFILKIILYFDSKTVNALYVKMCFFFTRPINKCKTINAFLT